MRNQIPQIPALFVNHFPKRPSNPFQIYLDQADISIELLFPYYQNPDALKRFYSDLMIRLSNRGQEVINLYTLGDEEELEKLRYYKALSNHYEDYADMIEFAYRLAEPNKPSSRNLQIYKHYFRARPSHQFV
ncbi:MAG: hypothetical protein IPN26_17640 [Bacteroidetes bacterium]|nr:hypothetical protein [Bacteroidota bacterium]